MQYTHRGTTKRLLHGTLKGQSCLALLKPRTWPRQARLAVITALSLAAFIFLFLSPRMPIGTDYHVFADHRTMVGIPHVGDVLSNIPFFVVGLWGLFWLGGKKSQAAFLDGRERIPYLVFFAGVMLTGIGSFWYHMAPSDARLPWDLLPMTCSFTSMVVVTYMERVHVRDGFLALLPVLLLGISSVVYWMVSNSGGNGDYKFYLFVQFFSPVLLALILGLFGPRYTGVGYLAIAFGLYVAAKLFETFDDSIYRHLGRAVSGHSLKHVTAAVACFWILAMLQHRRPLSQGSPSSAFDLPGRETAITF
jgi:hypothetical protein